MPPQKKTGRPPIGPTVKSSLGTMWIDRLNTVTETMQKFTASCRRGFNGIAIDTIEKRAWDRSGVIALLIQATVNQLAQNVLHEPNAVKRGDLCPLCWGYVDGPHSTDCGYFGPLAELDPDRGERLRAVLLRTGFPGHFRNVDGKVAEIYDLDAPAAAGD